MKYTFATLVINETNIDELLNLFNNGFYEESNSPIQELMDIKNGLSKDNLILFSTYEGLFKYVTRARSFHCENGYYDIPDIETLSAFLVLPTRKSREVFLKDYSSTYPFKALKERS